jgi:hypothetical protein
MQQQVAWATGRSRDEDWLLSAQSDTEAYFGRLARAREFSQRAFDSALHADAKETAALWQVNAALREAEFHAGLRLATMPWSLWRWCREEILGALRLCRWHAPAMNRRQRNLPKV